jgi:hypothetical protein
MSGWKWLVSSVNGLPHRVPDNESAIATLVGRGFEVTDLPGDWQSDDEEFLAALEEWKAGKEKAAKSTKEGQSATKSKKEDEK